MRPVGHHVVEVVLGDDSSSVHHEESVGLGFVEALGNRCSSTIDLNGHVEHVVLITWQLPHGTGSSTNSRRRDQLAHVREPPSIARGVLPVFECHKSARSKWRYAGHEFG